jgi:hypothetical protein
MSFTAAHESKDVRRACQSCQERKARFSYGGRVRADRDHTLCFECFRSERDRQRATRLAEVSTLAPRSPFLRPLTPRQVGHRQQMLVHLSSGMRMIYADGGRPGRLPSAGRTEST